MRTTCSLCELRALGPLVFSSLVTPLGLRPRAGSGRLPELLHENRVTEELNVLSAEGRDYSVTVLLPGFYSVLNPLSKESDWPWWSVSHQHGSTGPRVHGFMVPWPSATWVLKSLEAGVDSHNAVPLSLHLSEYKEPTRLVEDEPSPSGLDD